jgi:hypothetical protein
MAKLRWRIYYGDESTFDNLIGEPTDAPSWNVQAIVQPHIESGRYAICLYDYYIYREGRWFGVDIAGLVDYLLEIGFIRIGYSGRKVVERSGDWVEIDDFDLILLIAEDGLVKMGRMLRKEHFTKIYHKAETDPDFPKRTAYRSGERKP